MASVDVVILSIEPKPGRVHEVTYKYTITLHDDEIGRKASFDLEVGLTGVDVVWDEELGKGIDKHTVKVPPDTRVVTRTRKFTVASSVLDEDWGRDEIRIDLHVMDSVTKHSTVYSSKVFSGSF
jgi:hypothetical protein